MSVAVTPPDMLDRGEPDEATEHLGQSHEDYFRTEFQDLYFAVAVCGLVATMCVKESHTDIHWFLTLRLMLKIM